MEPFVNAAQIDVKEEGQHFSWLGRNPVSTSGHAVLWVRCKSTAKLNWSAHPWRLSPTSEPWISYLLLCMDPESDEKI